MKEHGYPYLISPDRLLPLENHDDYCELFMSLELWEPFVRHVCQRNRLDCQQVQAGLAGTYPTFMVDERWVVKFFGQQFDGEHAWAVERESARLVEGAPGIPAARLVRSGALFPAAPDLSWRYLVFEFLPGMSVGEQRDQLSHAERLRIAEEMADIARLLHCLPLEGSTVFRLGWGGYLAFLSAQREGCAAKHREWGEMPDHLIDQIDSYLLPIGAWVEPGSHPHFIHADLTWDHLLGTVEQGRWQTSGLIDFGDAFTGDIHYELVALHLAFFDCDKRLLQRFLDRYGGITVGDRFIHKTMSAALLHRFDAVGSLFTRFPHTASMRTLEELAYWLWNVRRSA
jgi:hypothetical protein